MLRQMLGLKNHHHPIDLFAEISALLSGFSFFPQLYHLYITHEIHGLSLPTFVMSFTANIIWFLYAIHRRCLPVLITATLVLISTGPIIVLFLLWNK